MRLPTRHDMSRVRRRARTLAACIETPSDVWLTARMLAWRIVLPALKYMIPLPRLAGLMWSEARRPPRRAGREQQIATLARGLYGPWELRALDNCLERSLIVYRFLSEAGAAPRLLVGVGKDDFVRGHAWVTLDGEPVNESRDSLDEFVPILAFGQGGAAQRLDPSRQEAPPVTRFSGPSSGPAATR
jgi:hypothetical protein